MKIQGFIGPAYELPDATNVEIQSCINLFLEQIQSGTGKDGQQAYLSGTYGLNKMFSLGQGPIRLIYFDGLQKNDGAYFQYNRLFVVSGAEVYRCFRDSSSGWQYDLMGSLNTYEGPVTAASLDIDYGVTVFADGSSENYVYHKTTTTTETFQTFTAAGYVPVERATFVIEIAGFLIFNQDGTNQFFVAEWNSLNVDPLSFATAEGSPDNIIAFSKLGNDLIIHNERTTEIWSLTGNADFPFERLAGGFIENGCLAPFSVAKIDSAILWIGRSESGQGVVYAASGTQPVRISTNAIEYIISSYASPSTARGFAYQQDGHSFYQLNFDEASWVYDLTTKAWHQRSYFVNGVHERHRAETGAFYPNTSQMVVGDYANSNIYFFDKDKYTDDGNTIVRKRSTPHITNSRKGVFFRELEIECDVGVGLDGGDSVQGSNPQIVLRWSDTNGRTWSNEKWTSLGRIGEWKTRVQWHRLGWGRDRVFEVTISDPVKVRLLDANLDVEGATS